MSNSITFRHFLLGHVLEWHQILVCCSTWKVESPANPFGRYEKCRFLSIFKNSYLGFQATNFNLATGIFKVFSRSFCKNYRNTLASNPYFSQLLKRNTVRPKASRTQKYAKNRNLKLNTFNNGDLKVFSKTFQMPVAKLHSVA